jgi:hypothetical protein
MAAAIFDSIPIFAKRAGWISITILLNRLTQVATAAQAIANSLANSGWVYSSKLN